jgi:hypothetical protein
MKNLDQIWQDYINQDTLSTETINDLIWHIENDKLPEEAITMATDMIVESSTDILLRKLTPCLVKQLDHEDDFIRELAVGCVVGRLRLSEYASKALDMAKNDPYDNVRGLASFQLGAVIDKVELHLREQIANYLYEVITNNNYDGLHKQCAYGSILKAMKVPMHLRPAKKLEPDIPNMIDKDLLEKFKIKYNIKDEK